MIASHVLQSLAAGPGSGRPLAVAFHFQHQLEDGRFRWIRRKNGVYVPFVPPLIGQTVLLPEIRIAPASP